jgi:hypothetical protein
MDAKTFSLWVVLSFGTLAILSWAISGCYMRWLRIRAQRMEIKTLEIETQQLRAKLEIIEPPKRIRKSRARLNQVIDHVINPAAAADTDILPCPTCGANNRPVKGVAHDSKFTLTYRCVRCSADYEASVATYPMPGPLGPLDGSGTVTGGAAAPVVEERAGRAGG